MHLTGKNYMPNNSICNLQKMSGTLSFVMWVCRVM